MLFQLMIQILPVTGGCFHPDEDLAGRNIQLGELVQQHVPSWLGISKLYGFDDHAFVWPTDTARTGLAGDVNPTDVFDGGVLF
jgi:hypothetical protein